MAKITGPLFSMEARGKFGDVVFLQRGGRAIARKRVIPQNPKSVLQQAVRTNLGSLSNIYSERFEYDAAAPPAGVTTYEVRRVDRGPDPAVVTPIQERVLANSEAATWDSMQQFVGHNATRLSNNLAIQRTNPAA